MSKIIFLYILIFISTIHVFSQNRLITGTVRDESNNEIVSYCNVRLLNSTIGTTTDEKGNFKLEIPSKISNPKLIVSYLGFNSKNLLIDSLKNEYFIYLEAKKSTLDEVVVTGVTKATLLKENPVAIVSISSKAIEKSAESNIIDVLVKNVPGLNAVKTGPNISKPFIRGLGYNRVLTLYDGVRQEGQQWGDEHGIEVDAYNIERAEVIKGPASLMYGSDALAGVVSMLPSKPTDTDGKIKGKYISEYQSNNGLIGAGLRLNFRNTKWLWAARGSYRIAKNYTNKIDNRVYNTGFNEKNASLLFGHTSSKGFSHLNFTLYENFQGIPDGSRDSLSRKFSKQISESLMDDVKSRPIVSDAELNSYKLSPLHQLIQHYRIYINNNYQIGKGEIDFNIAFQQNARKEFNHPTVPDQPGLSVRLNTFNYNLKYNAPAFFNIETSFGLNGMNQMNKNKNGTDFPIPDYALFDVGVYTFLKWKSAKWTISGGIRYDTRNVKAKDFYIRKNPDNKFDEHVLSADIKGAELQFPNFSQNFKGISLSVGSTYKINDFFSVKANIARGYRAPNISEIASNGLDPGAHIIYIGNKNFQPEFSIQQDLGIIVASKEISGSVSIFNNNIQNYIYLELLSDANGKAILDPQGNKTFQYLQSSARLYGLEATFNYNPSFIKGFSFNSNLSTVYGFNKKEEFSGKGINGEYLPFIPPLKLIVGVNQDFKTKLKLITNINLKADLEHSDAQNRYLSLFNTETPTKAFNIFNVAIGTDIKYNEKNILQFNFQVNNVFDMVYQSNLSRLKYFEYYSKTSNGYAGMYGMGRNICFKVIWGF